MPFLYPNPMRTQGRKNIRAAAQRAAWTPKVMKRLPTRATPMAVPNCLEVLMVPDAVPCIEGAAQESA